VGGEAAESLDFAAHQEGRLLLVIGFVLLLTMLIMAATFRSLLLAAVSSVLNLASVGVAFGVLTLVFQEGWGSGLLDFASPGFVIDWIPLFVLVVLVGLSMDYHVFVLSRIREHLGRGLTTTQAVERGIVDTAGVVTSAAAVMVSVFAIFATLSMLEMKMMGVGLSAAILLDATIIRLVMLPAILVLLGRRGWWPRRLTRPQGLADLPRTRSSVASPTPASPRGYGDGALVPPPGAPSPAPVPDGVRRSRPASAPRR
jgi:RND superfamily putative drug exporter